jgi:hypothetical protein
MKRLSLQSRDDSMICPLCEGHELGAQGHSSARCESCGGILSGAMLEALRQISALPEALGTHACECGHPEMRLLPDRTYHCPSCGSEVLPVDVPSHLSESEENGLAYWSGWADGRFGERGSFVDNPNLARWETPLERLAYYRGHRSGSEARRDRSGPLLARARKVGP